MPRVLVVDDDKTVGDVVARYLQRDGYDVDLAQDGAAALMIAAATPPDLVILDLMLPTISGLEVCRRLREAGPVPVIMLTARSDEEDRVAGLEIGADDYVTKPFSPRELVLRVGAVLRRAQSPLRRDGTTLADGDLVVHTAAHEVTMNGSALMLTAREFDLLVFFMRNPRTAFSREELLERVWDWTFGDASTVTVHVRRLREKVETDPSKPVRLVTVWGVGYRFEPGGASMTHMIVTSALVTLGAGLLGGGLVWLLRGRGILLTMTLTVLTAVAAMAAGVLVAADQMFISRHDVGVTIAIVITAAVVGTATTLVFGHRVASTVERHEQAAAARDHEREIEASRRELVAWMSHDLRSPLAAIRAMAEALEDGVVDDPATVMGYFRSIGLETRKLSEMVDDLFMLARLHDGRIALDKQRVTVADLVAQATSSAAPLARARNIELYGDAPEVPVSVDVKQVARLLGNLLSNAIRHSPHGGRVHITGGVDGAEVLLSVEDQCGGIAGEDLPRLFDVSFRGTAARTPSADGGAGLGLAIARGITDAHGGSIEVANIRAGCRFTARLPADRAEAEVSEPALHR